MLYTDGWFFKGSSAAVYIGIKGKLFFDKVAFEQSHWWSEDASQVHTGRISRTKEVPILKKQGRELQGRNRRQRG